MAVFNGILLVSTLLTSTVAALTVYLEPNATCQTPDRRDGLCVYYTECPAMMRLLSQKHLSDEQRRYARASQCGYVDRQYLVCCVPAFVLPIPGVCGQSGTPTKVDNAVISSPHNYVGRATGVGEFPWTALLQYATAAGANSFKCGGTLITDKYVLTAAHCIFVKDDLNDIELTSVRLGEYNKNTLVDCGTPDNCSDPPLDIPIMEMMPHERYIQTARTDQQHDIALLRLARAVVFTRWISPICLPIADHIRNDKFENRTLTLAGFGNFNKAELNSVKHKIENDVIAKETCQQRYASGGRTITDTHICAGGVQRNETCYGMAGDALMGITMGENGAPYSYLVGIVSFGPRPCGLAGWPIVYTRINSYTDWITSKLSG